jgi:hypothetical protein
MSLSKTFESKNNNSQMDTLNVTGSGDDRNNVSTQRSNGHSTTPAYEGNYQVDISSTSFELETITSSYTGLMRIYRLLYIADHCQSLSNEALLTSLKYIQETHFISLYKQVQMNRERFFDRLFFLSRYLMN